MLSATTMLVPAFVAGLFTFLVSCALPLVPAYLIFIGGVSLNDLSDPARAAFARRRIRINGLFYVIGFSAVFVLLGTLFGIGGGALVQYRIPLYRAGGALIVLFGLTLLGLFGRKVRLFDRTWHPSLPSWLHPGRPFSSLVFGATFAFGWTPCIGPILGSVLLLASTTGTLVEGALLLAVFAAGLGLPFLLLAFAFSTTTVWLQKFSHMLPFITKIAGLLLVFLGLTILFNSFGEWTGFWYRIFGVFNYAGILRYL